ncbi:MAG: ABC transporter ATP-binding protein [Hyphomicrobiaceae bacterium]
MTSDMASALVVDELTKIYSAGATGGGGGIHPISFSLDSGAFFTLLGPSGCGKTTTLRCIAGLEQPDSGRVSLGDTVFLDSQKNVSVPLNQRNIGMVFQSYAIWPHMSVFENVAFPLRVARGESYSKADVTRLVGEALETVELGGFGQRSPTQLSGGQQQRVALARAIVRHPRLLLLDEPLSNLDAKLRDEMRAELKRLQKRIGVTTLYVTHDQAEALEMSDLIAVINKGRLVQLGTPREIYFEPADAFVAGFMGSPNLLKGISEGGAAGGAIGGVRLEDGRIVSCRLPKPIAGGKPVIVSVRPEFIMLAAEGTSAPAGANALAGTVISSGFLGEITRYRLQSGEITIEANANSSQHIENGSKVTMVFPAEKAIGLNAGEA